MTAANTDQLKSLNESGKIELSYEVGGKNVAATSGQDLEQVRKDILKLADKYAAQGKKLKVRVVVQEP